MWREIWDQVGPRATSAMTANEGTYDEALLLIMELYGYREETYYTIKRDQVPGQPPAPHPHRRGSSDRGLAVFRAG